jgi:uroporphyrinogen-III decarboxylase
MISDGPSPRHRLMIVLGHEFTGTTTDLALDPIRAPTGISRRWRAVDRFAGRRAVVFRVQDPFCIPRYMRGVETMLKDLILNPSLIGEMVEIAVQISSALARRAVEVGADAIFTSDDCCDNRGPMMSRRHFHEFLFPGLKRVVEAVHAACVPFIEHTDGNVLPVLDDPIAAGIDCLDPLHLLGGIKGSTPSLHP